MANNNKYNNIINNNNIFAHVFKETRFGVGDWLAFHLGSDYRYVLNVAFKFAVSFVITFCFMKTLFESD